MPIEGIVELEPLNHRMFFGINNHEIGIAFADVNTHVKRFHFEASFFFGIIMDARNHQPCNYAVSCTKLIPDLNLAEGRN